jgi:hypothetical protein
MMKSVSTNYGVRHGAIVRTVLVEGAPKQSHVTATLLEALVSEPVRPTVSTRTVQEEIGHSSTASLVIFLDRNLQ